MLGMCGSLAAVSDLVGMRLEERLISIELHKRKMEKKRVEQEKLKE